MPKPSLRAVEDGEAPVKSRDLGLSLDEAVVLGDYLQILYAQRREIATSIPEEKGPAKAALHRQLGITSKEIDVLELKASQEVTANAAVPDEAFDAEAI